MKRQAVREKDLNNKKQQQMPFVTVAESIQILEPRYMFDAAGVATVSEIAVENVAEAQADSVNSESNKVGNFTAQAVR